MSKTTFSASDKRWSIGALIVAVIAGSFMVVNPPHLKSDDGFGPCPTEDSVNCYWDAKTMGDGNGTSFVVGPTGIVHYLDK